MTSEVKFSCAVRDRRLCYVGCCRSVDQRESFDKDEGKMLQQLSDDYELRIEVEEQNS